MIKYANNLPYGLTIINDHTVRKTVGASFYETVEFMRILVNHLIRYPDPMVVPVSNFVELGYNNGYYHYSYDMARLGLLSESEKILIDGVTHQLYRHGVQYADPFECPNPILKESLSAHPTLAGFMKECLKQNRYHDLHSGNVMIDLEENYLLIDLEGFIRDRLSHENNQWITQEQNET